MSEETPQKGWDSWFDVPSNASPGDDEQLAEQSEVQAPPTAQPPRELPQTPRELPQRTEAPEPPKAQPAADSRVAPARHGRVYGASTAAGTPAAGTARTDTTDETNAAATAVGRVPEQASHWTAPSPSMGRLLEGQDAQATQVVTPGSIPAQATQPAQSTQAAPSAQGAQAAQANPSAQAAEPTQSIQSVQPTQFIQPVTPPGSGSAPGQGQAHRNASAPLPGSDALPTQRVAPQPLSSADMPTAVSSVPPPAAPPIPAAPAGPAGPATAPAWQAPQPAQMWGEAPRGYPQAAAPPPPPQGPADDEFAGWDDQFDRGRPRSVPAPAPAEERVPPRSRKKLALASGIATVGVVGLVAVLVFNNGGLPGSGGAKAKPSGFQPTATTTAGEAEQTAQAFLAAWQSGNFASASQYTDDPAAALSTLTSYRNGLNLNGLQLTAQSATANSSSSTGTSTNSTASASAGPSGTVSFSVAAKVGLPATSASTSTSSASSSSSTSASTGSTGSAGTSTAPTATANWTYTSTLTAYEKNGGWWVKWAPALVAPNLTATEKLVSVAVAPTASEVTDASGNDLSGATDVGVKNIAAALKKNAPTGQGTPGVEIELEKADGTPIPGTTDQLSQPVNTGVVKTTINPTVESAAQAAVLKYAKSSMVVIRPSTGEILAVANNNGQNDFALTARVAPGSTNKIITTTALLTSGLVSSTSQAVECPKTITVNGTTFANSQNEFEPASTPFLTDFAVSCNNAFGQWYTKIGSTTLAQTAQQYYGLNQQWNIGLGEAGPYYTIPSSSSNGELFQELFGQGQLEASPLAMTSVAATVDTGDFKQPIVVPGQAQVSATALPSTVQQELKQLMHAVTQSGGTAAGVFDGVNSTVYGKTGTADVGGGGSTAAQANPNSWMVVFDPTLDLAIGCVVLDAGYGASYAGPETAAVLKALQ